MTIIKDQRLYALIVFGLFLLGNLPGLNAQPTPPSQTALEWDLTRAEAYVYSHSDSTITLTDRILKVLKTRNQVDTPFGLRVQLTQTLALEKNGQDGLALQKLLRIEQLSREKELWEIHARTCLELALVYEKTEFAERSRQYLDLAKAEIDRYGLQSVYPRFAVRMASWQWVFKGNDNSALFFAHEALRTTPSYGLLQDEADGHLLINML